MAYIQERKTQDGKTHFRVQIRLKGHPITSGTFERRTDAKLWIQQTESAMREGRFFKTSESKKHTLAQLIDRYIENVIPTKSKDKKTTSTQLMWWKKQIGHCLLLDISPACIAEQRDILLLSQHLRLCKRETTDLMIKNARKVSASLTHESIKRSGQSSIGTWCYTLSRHRILPQ